MPKTRRAMNGQDPRRRSRLTSQSHDPAGGVDVVVVEHVAGGPGAAGGLAHAPVPVAVVAVPVAAVVVAVAAVRAAAVTEICDGTVKLKFSIKRNGRHLNTSDALT